VGEGWLGLAWLGSLATECFFMTGKNGTDANPTPRKIVESKLGGDGPHTALVLVHWWTKDRDSNTSARNFRGANGKYRNLKRVLFKK
jgi:hypothetical protein